MRDCSEVSCYMPVCLGHFQRSEKACRQHSRDWVTTAACCGVAQSRVHHAGTHSPRSLSRPSYPRCARSASRGDGAAEVEAVLRLREADRANSAELPAVKRRRVHDGGTVLAVRARLAGRLGAQAARSAGAGAAGAW